MCRPSSFVARALRALTAVVTVWCLGCSAFEPLLSRLTGEPSGAGLMVCDGGATGMSEAGGSATRQIAADGPTATAAHGQAATIGAVPTQHGARGYDCGCQSCHAPELMLAAMPTPITSAPTLAPAEPRPLVSIEREPLVPPPQAAR